RILKKYELQDLDESAFNESISTSTISLSDTDAPTSSAPRGKKSKIEPSDGVLKFKSAKFSSLYKIRFNACNMN
ncbi:hypothetical protein, partial [Bacteroides heparinolyticus]|uniref:hypothetical protein n=1 Tax=Prevotella heparinolytica TaxID=28113 RepID=UPI00359F87CE